MDQNDPKFAMTVSFRAENREKNRYIDIMPYDWSRYRFRSDSTAPHGSEQTQDEEYINANYVNMNEDSRQWIAAQGPLPQTLTHFWRMIYESNCRLILMVTQTTENGRQKCARYWPATPEVVSPYNEVTLELESELDESDGIIELTLVFKTKGKIERRVRQIQFIDWPDHGVPHDPSHFLQFLRKVREYKAEDAKSEKVGATIVHCSAGVGRTGVTIALDAAAEKIEKNQKIDPRQLLIEMREQRGCLIQTVEQFEFVCQTIVHLYHQKQATIEETEL